MEPAQRLVGILVSFLALGFFVKVSMQKVFRTFAGLPAQYSASKARVSRYGTFHFSSVALDHTVDYVTKKAIIVPEQATRPRSLRAMMSRRRFLAILVEVELVDAAIHAAAGASGGHSAGSYSPV